MRYMRRNAKGQMDGVLREEPPQAGANVKLTIDARIQMIAEEALRAVGRGAAVVVDPNNGNILAMVSVPSFDPNTFIPSIKAKDWEVLRKDEANPLINRAVSAFPPGSTFKLVTTLAGLRKGLGNQRFNCGGGVALRRRHHGGRLFRVGPPARRCARAGDGADLRHRRHHRTRPSGARNAADQRPVLPVHGPGRPSLRRTRHRDGAGLAGARRLRLHLDPARLLHVPGRRAADSGPSGFIQATANGPTFPPIAHEPTSQTGLSHTNGAISMSRFAPGTATADFVLCVGDNTFMDAGRSGSSDKLGYAAFGHVVAGMDVVKKILHGRIDPKTPPQGGWAGQMLLHPVKIIKAERIAEEPDTDAASSR